MNLEILNQKNFKYQEFFFSQTAIDNNIDNQAEFFKDIQYKALILNGVHLANTLQKIRNLMNASEEFKEIVKNDEIIININSGYRCPELNKLVGSRPTSQHTRFEAVDFTVNGIKNHNKLKEIGIWLKKQKLAVDQCLVEETWIHLSAKLKDNRNQFATYIKDKNTKKYIFTTF